MTTGFSSEKCWDLLLNLKKNFNGHNSRVARGIMVKIKGTLCFGQICNYSS